MTALNAAITPPGLYKQPHQLSHFDRLLPILHQMQLKSLLQDEQDLNERLSAEQRPENGRNSGQIANYSPITPSATCGPPLSDSCGVCMVRGSRFLSGSTTQRPVIVQFYESRSLSDNAVASTLVVEVVVVEWR